VISSQGASCFVHSRVPSIHKVLLPATSHIASHGLHAIPFTNTASRHSNQILQRLVLLQHLLLFIGTQH